MDIWNHAGAAITLLLGFTGLFFPKRVAGFLRLNAKDKTGNAEFRAQYGGLVIMLAGIAIWTAEPTAYACTGAAWIGSAFGRLVSIFVDKAGTTRNWQLVVMSTAIGTALIY